MLHRLILNFALVLLLGFSQQSALLHGISHLTDISPLSEQQDQAPHHAASCEHCLSFSNLVSTVTSNHHLSFKVQASEMPAIFVGMHHQPLAAQAYIARAPPNLT